jgi:competence protein ComEA
MAHDDDTSDAGEAGHERLRSMGLRADPGGWVPEVVPAFAAPAASPPAGPDTRIGAPNAGSSGEAPTLAALAGAWVQDRVPPWAHGITSLGAGSVLGAAVVVVAVVVAAVALMHHHPTAAAPSYGSSASAGSGGTAFPDPSASSAAGGFADPTSIVVDVGGRVRKPGLVTLPSGSRVADAITAAGGPLHHREIARLDLASRVTDGQLLLVGVPSAGQDGGGAADPGGPSAPSSSSPVDLSSATLEQLETLPGVGPVTGQKIIDWRTAHSGFTSIQQLQQVSGIGPATYAELAPLVAP